MDECTPLPTGHTLWREEIFGPVMCVRTFQTEAEAVEVANDTEFGLAAAVISGDAARCDRLAAAFQTGIVVGRFKLTPD